MKYRKKPVVIEAVQWNGANSEEIKSLNTNKVIVAFYYGNNPRVEIKTLEGIMTATLSDWIIKGVAGELYPCKDEIFQKTYELVPPQL